MILDVLPTPRDPGWAKMSDFERKFLPSVLGQYERKGELTERQYEILERIWSEKF